MAINGIYREVTMDQRVTFTSEQFPEYKIIIEQLGSEIVMILEHKDGAREVYKRMSTERKEDES